jgi:DNA-binding LacI/PurR family transcriptional regulator
MSVTMKDIAMLAGVSRQAVSAVLSGSRHTRVAEATRERVRKLARELNYIPNQAARSLSGGKTHTIGFFGGLFSPYGVNAALLSEVSGALRSQGYYVIGGHHGFGDVDEDVRFLAGFVSRGVDGVVVYGSGRHEPGLEEAVTVPHVFCSPHAADEGCDVGVDSVGGGAMATQHLIEHGHSRIAYLRIAPHETRHRLVGWRQALREAGLEDGNGMVLTLRDLDGSADAVLAELRRLRITAVFAQNDSVAAKLMNALVQRGVRIPDDIAIVGYDGSSFANFCPVPLTTVVQPIREQAEAITKLLLERVTRHEVRAAAANIVVEPLLYRGGSCGCPPRPINRLYRINSPDTLELDCRLNFGIEIEDICGHP